MFFRFLVITSFFPVVTADVHKKCSCYDNGCYFNGQLQLIEPIKRVVHHYDDFALRVVIGIAIEGESPHSAQVFYNATSLTIDWLPQEHDTIVQHRVPPILQRKDIQVNNNGQEILVMQFLFADVNMRLRSAYEIKLREAYDTKCRRMLRFRPQPTLDLVFACETIADGVCNLSIPEDFAPICGLSKNVRSSATSAIEWVVEFTVDVSMLPLALRRDVVDYVAFIGECDADLRVMIRDHCTLDMATVRNFSLCRSDTRNCAFVDRQLTVSNLNLTNYGMDVCAMFNHSQVNPSPVNEKPLIVPELKLASVTADHIGSINITALLGYVFVLLILTCFVTWIVCRRCCCRRTNNKHYRHPVPISLQMRDPWELEDCDLTIHYDKKLGSGAFGAVYLGTIAFDYRSPANGPVVLNDHHHVATTEETARNDFLNEMSLNKTVGRHSALVNMVGMITLREPLCLVTEYCANGDLLRYLRLRCAYMIKLQDMGIDLESDDLDANPDIDLNFVLTLKIVLRFALQICVGMEYLSSRQLIHRDIAARNILVTADNNAKIGDFGLCRHADGNDLYYRGHGGHLPLKWMAPEAITGSFSLKTDVWSFGIVLFELITLGGSPYPGVQPQDLYEYLVGGQRNAQPDNCSAELYAVMLECWSFDPAERPTFLQLRCRLADLIDSTISKETTANYYLQLNRNCDYYNFHGEWRSLKTTPSDDKVNSSDVGKETKLKDDDDMHHLKVVNDKQLGKRVSFDESTATNSRQNSLRTKMSSPPVVIDDLTETERLLGYKG